MGEFLAEGQLVSIRLVQSQDLESIAPHGYSVSVVDSLTDLADLQDRHSCTGLWQADSGAVSVVENENGMLVGTCQFFRSGPCIHGVEIGYIVHSESNWGKGYASEALKLFSQYVFEVREQHHRHQLTIEISNKASVKVAEKCGFKREGILRGSGFAPSYADCFVYSRLREDGT